MAARSMDKASDGAVRRDLDRFLQGLGSFTNGDSPEERAAITGSVPKPVLTIIGGVFGRGYHPDVAPAWRT